MFTLNNRDSMLEKREARYHAECALADSLDVLSAIVSLPVKNKAEKTYCYCNLSGKNATFVAFYSIGDKAYLYTDEMGKNEMMDFNMAVMSQLVYLKSQYEDCPQLLPSELFLEFDPNSRNINAYAGMQAYSDPNDASIRSLIWFKEHGGKLPRSAEIAMKMGPFKAKAREYENPSSKAAVLDMEALDLSRKYVAGEIDDPSLAKPECGWDAVRAELLSRYKSDDSMPMSFESDDSKTWVDVYEVKNCWHYLSCGLSAMGTADQAGNLGGEYHLILKKKNNQDEDDAQIFAVLNQLREAIEKAQREGKLMEEYSYMETENGGLIALPDSKLSTVQAPCGSIELRMLVCITKSELAALKDGSINVQQLSKKLDSQISDFSRK